MNSTFIFKHMCSETTTNEKKWHERKKKKKKNGTCNYDWFMSNASHFICIIAVNNSNKGIWCPVCVGNGAIDFRLSLEATDI